MQINIETIQELIAQSKVESEGLGKIINPIIEKYKLSKKEILEGVENYNNAKVKPAF